MEAVARVGPNGSGGGATFINGMTQNIVTRSRYGRRAIGNMTRDIRPAKNLVASTSTMTLDSNSHNTHIDYF